MKHRMVSVLCTGVLCILVVMPLTGCNEFAGSLSQGLAPSESLVAKTQPEPSQVTTARSEPEIPPEPDALVIEGDIQGDGQSARPGDKVTIHYTGCLIDGTEFETTLNDEPVSFTIGGDKVVRGLSRGVIGMMVGGKRTLTIQPEIAYGEEGDIDRSIPPSATVVFEVELLKIHK